MKKQKTYVAMLLAALVILSLAGSGMNATNAKQMMDETGIYQVHSSCKNWLNDPTTTGDEVTYSFAPEPHENDYDVVDEGLVRKLVESIR